MKKAIKIYLEPTEFKNLKSKAEALGFIGKGNISHYIQKIAKCPIVFLDDNTQAILKALQLKTGIE